MLTHEEDFYVQSTIKGLNLVLNSAENKTDMIVSSSLDAGLKRLRRETITKKRADIRNKGNRRGAPVFRLADFD